jgi:hypothetical protein
MNPNLIALYSPTMGHGKTTVTRTLHDHGFMTVKLAGTLKDMIRVFLRDLGIAPNVIEGMVEGNRKEAPIPGLPGVTPRSLMQTLGTDWGRTFIRPSIWIEIALARTRRLLNSGHKVVIDDLRFPNEFIELKDLGAIMVKVVRPGVQATNNHPSEGLLNDHPWDATILNDGTLAELRDKTLDILKVVA